VSKTKERTATTSTVKLKNCMQEAAKKNAKGQQNAFKHTARQGKGEKATLKIILVRHFSP